MLHVNREAKSKLQWDKVKDSANKTAFGTGSMRDTQDNKGRYDLIPSSVLKRLAQHYENGARKYAERNWEKGQPLHQYYNSALRHLEAIKDADISEDHFAAAIWNVAAMIHHIDAMLVDDLPESLDSFGIVKAIKEHDTFEQIREYYNEPIASASNHEGKPVATLTLNKHNRSRWIPTVVSGAVSDLGILDGIVNDNAERARTVQTFVKLDPEELG